MARQKYKCVTKCFAYNKLFKKGEMFPVAWMDSGYTPPPEYFCKAEDYEDAIKEVEVKSRIIYSAAEDPRPTAQLIEELARFMDVPKDWNRKRIWMALKQREMAEEHTEPTTARRGRPPKE
jgi:hypothetical protein